MKKSLSQYQITGCSVERIGGDDCLFATPRKPHDFNFGKETARVFDDMVNRSVPYYSEIQRMVCELSSNFASDKTVVYDVGCATGTTLGLLNDHLDYGIELVGIDNSEEMLNKAREKLGHTGTGHPIRFINADLNDAPGMPNGSVVIMLLTLQFVRPLNREKLIKSAFDGLNRNGCLILVEKVTGYSTLLNRLYIDYYYEYKRRMGYSDLEIAQKREALENILIPYHFEENKSLLSMAGFSQVEEFFRWYNFSGIVAVK
jgi:tRNA (cmo5U34)-methyltransferase